MVLETQIPGSLDVNFFTELIKKTCKIRLGNINDKGGGPYERDIERETEGES